MVADGQGILESRKVAGENCHPLRARAETLATHLPALCQL